MFEIVVLLIGPCRDKERVLEQSSSTVAAQNAAQRFPSALRLVQVARYIVLAMIYRVAPPVMKKTTQANQGSSP